MNDADIKREAEKLAKFILDLFDQDCSCTKCKAKRLQANEFALQVCNRVRDSQREEDAKKCEAIAEKHREARNGLVGYDLSREQSQQQGAEQCAAAIRNKEQQPDANN